MGKYDIAGRFLLLILIVSFIAPLNMYIFGIAVYPFDLALTPLFVIWVIKFRQIHLDRIELRAILLLSMFVFWILVTVWFSVDIHGSLSDALLWGRILLIFSIIVSTYNVWYDITDVGWMATFLVLFQGSLAIIQAITQSSVGQLNQYFGTGEVIQSYQRYGDQLILRSQGTLGNPNTLSNWLIILFPLTLLSHRGNIRRTKILLLTATIGFFALVTTQTRGTMIILVSLVVLLTIFHIFKPSYNRSSYNFITVVFVVLIFLIGFIMRELPYIERLTDITGDSVRFRKMVESIDVLLNYPMTGTGYGAYGVGRDVLGLRIGFRSTSVHNIPLRIAAETGIVGMILFIIFFTYCLRVFILSYHNSQSVESGVYLFIFMALIGIMMIYTSPVGFQFLPLYMAALASGVAICSSISHESG